MIFIIKGFPTLVFILMIFPQRFSQYVRKPLSGVCRTQELTWNFELRHLLNPWASLVLIPLDTPGYKC